MPCRDDDVEARRSAHDQRTTRTQNPRQTSVTPDMFEAGLRTLGRQTFDLDAVELDHLVSTLDSNGSGTIELDDFMTFCLSIPSLPWRAERARRLE